MVNAYYIEAVVCTTIGTIWSFIFKTKRKKLQNDNLSNWIVDVKNQKSEDDKNTNTMNLET